ncbi:MAG TPA: hypothetical protein VNS81_10325 [Nocardioides sp.]|nr:hypothetical protein [Nocardioides sp.]
MRFPSLRSRGFSLAVGPGERVLATAPVTGTEEVVGGTRDALYLPQRVPWEQVAAADWDQDASVLTVVEVAAFGEPSPTRRLHLEPSARFLQLVRERVTASIVLQRHVAVLDRRGVRVLGRRAPGRPGPLTWFVEYDAGLDPADPRVVEVVEAALAAARADVGLVAGLDF